MVIAISSRRVYQIANRIKKRIGTSKERPGDFERLFTLAGRYSDLTRNGDGIDRKAIAGSRRRKSHNGNVGEN